MVSICGSISKCRPCPLSATVGLGNHHDQSKNIRIWRLHHYDLVLVVLEMILDLLICLLVAIIFFFTSLEEVTTRPSSLRNLAILWRYSKLHDRRARFKLFKLGVM